MSVRRAIAALLLAGCTSQPGGPGTDAGSGGASTCGGCTGLSPSERDAIDTKNAAQDTRIEAALGTLQEAQALAVARLPPGQLTVLPAGAGLLLKAPGGTCHRTVVMNGGALVTTPVACP